MSFKHARQNWLQQNTWDKGRENANIVLYCFSKFRANAQYSSNPLEIFHSLCKNPFTKSKPHRDNSSLVFRNPYNLRDPRSLNQSLCITRKKRNSLLKRRILQLKSMDELLMNLQVFAQEFLLREHLAMKFSWNISLIAFWSQTHTYI